MFSLNSIIVIIYIDLIIECCWLKLLFIGHLQSTCSNNDLIGWETPLLKYFSLYLSAYSSSPTNNIKLYGLVELVSVYYKIEMLR